MKILIVSVIIFTSLFYAIAEFFGSRKHIGKWWSFLLLMAGIVPGLIALLVSPSAKKNPTNGNIYHTIFGWILLVLLGIIGLIPYFVQLSNGYHINSSIGVPISCIFLGLYLIEMGKGKIRNNNPKFYFSTSTQFGKTENKPISFEEQKKLLLDLKNANLLTEIEYNEKMKHVLSEQLLSKDKENGKQFSKDVNDAIDSDLKKLIDLKNSNILSEEEFANKKGELLIIPTLNISNDHIIHNAPKEIVEDSEANSQKQELNKNEISTNNSIAYNFGKKIKKLTTKELVVYTVIGIFIIILGVFSINYISENSRKNEIKSIIAQELYQAKGWNNQITKNMTQSEKDKIYLHSMEHYQNAAKLGSGEAIVSIGCLYRDGHGVAKDLNKAFIYFNKGADLSNADATYLVGGAYYYGNGVTQNQNIALKYFKKADLLGESNAAENIAMCYLYNDEIIKINGDSAYFYIQKSIKQGNTGSYYDLGHMYEKGIFVNKDLKEAFNNYNKVAYIYYGEGFFINEVARCFEEGIGVVMNKDSALFYYQKALSKGYEDSRIKIEELSSLKKQVPNPAIKQSVLEKLGY